MTALSSEVVRRFCEYCGWTYRVWKARKIVFDDNSRVEELSKSRIPYYLEMLSMITQEYSLHQIAMLHDPAVQHGQINLTIEYVVKFGGWDSDVLNRLNGLKEDLDRFAGVIRSARNKILSHRDLETILAGKPLGKFEAGADDTYFQKLQEFVDLVHDKTIGGPYPLAEATVLNDAGALVHLLLDDAGNRSRA
jgi:hypothetical protein